MSEKLDVQVHPVGVSLIYPRTALDENLPGQLNLTHDEADDLYHQMREVWLIRLGLEQVEIRWCDAQPGDIIESLGMTLKDTPHILPNSPYLRAYFGSLVEQIDLLGNQLIRVNRRIA